MKSKPYRIVSRKLDDKTLIYNVQEPFFRIPVLGWPVGWHNTLYCAYYSAEEALNWYHHNKKVGREQKLFNRANRKKPTVLTPHSSAEP